ncbi:MAG: lytic transglycosylase domain-containing protein, partial [Rhodospirillales bacterium]
WRLGKFKVARDQFKLVFSSSYASSWLISAGAFWASRATIKIRRPQEFSRYLQVAAKYPRTFYGILASHILNKKVEYNWTPPPLAKEIVAELAAAPGGSRAVALIQVGEDRLAERELRIIFSTAKPELARAMLAIADRAEMPALAMRLGTMLDSSGSTLYDSTAYPAPTLKMGTKEVIDRELILAIVRQESGFNPKAKSPRGARGLMQLMPGTASFVAKDRRYRGSKRNSLYDPGTNIALGQRYIDILLMDKVIKGNLFRMVTAWNAGPGNLNKWNRKVKYNNDPLLFIESLPSKETRIFVERVVANYWIYRGRFNQSTNTLGELAAGNWPIYHSERLDAVELAEGIPK